MDLKKSQKHLIVAMYNYGLYRKLIRFEKRNPVAFQPWILEFDPPLDDSEKGLYQHLVTSRNPQIKVYIPQEKFSGLVANGLLTWLDNDTVSLTPLGIERGRIWHSQGYHAVTIR